MTGFAKEKDLCALFIKCLPEGWTAYPETGGFDILLVRDRDGFQIGVEAKLRLNAKVILQAMEGRGRSYVMLPDPDCRAVLIPDDARGGLEPVCAALGITPNRMNTSLVLGEDGGPIWESARKGHSSRLVRADSGIHEIYTYPFRPELPTGEEEWRENWFERCPDQRLQLPDYVPDVAAGDTAPVALTVWKVKAIKIAITLEKRGYVTRRDFKHFNLSMSRWIDPCSGWLVKNGEGGWVGGKYLPDFRKQHPVNYEQIEADYEKWKSPPEATQPGLFAGKVG